MFYKALWRHLKDENSYFLKHRQILLRQMVSRIYKLSKSRIACQGLNFFLTLSHLLSKIHTGIKLTAECL